MVWLVITDPFQQAPQKAGHHGNVDRIADKAPLSSAVQVAWQQGSKQHAMILCICIYTIKLNQFYLETLMQKTWQLHSNTASLRLK